MSARKLVVTPDPSAEVPRYHRWPTNDAIETPVVIRFSAAAYEAAHAHVLRGLLQSEGGEQHEHRMEVKGALLGFAAELEEGEPLQVWVQEAIPLPLLPEDGPVSCVYRARDKVHVELLCERSYGGLQVVGWFHSHPGLHVFLSDVDRETMHRAFPLPHHVALVIDPVFDEAAFFVWEDDEIDQQTRERFVPSALCGQKVRGEASL